MNFKSSFNNFKNIFFTIASNIYMNQWMVKITVIDS